MSRSDRRNAPCEGMWCITVNAVSESTREEYEECFRVLFKRMKADHVLLVEEVGTRYGFHYHCFCGPYQVKKAMVQHLMREVFGRLIEGHKQYTVAPWDGDQGWLQYCSKGPNSIEGEYANVKMNTGYDTNRFHHAFFEHSAKVDAAKKAAAKKYNSLGAEFFAYTKDMKFLCKEDVLRECERFVLEKVKKGERVPYLARTFATWCASVWYRAKPERALDSVFAQVRDMF